MQVFSGILFRRSSEVLLTVVIWAFPAICNAAAIVNTSSLATTDIVVNFDSPNLVFGTEIRNQYASVGVIFGGSSYLGFNLINPNLVSYIPNGSAPNALQVVPGASTSGLDVEFLGSVTEFGFNYEVGLFANLIISAYSPDNSLIETQTFTPTSGFAGLVESKNISRVQISSLDLRFGNPDSINFGMDNFAFTAVPEPAIGALILIGGVVISLQRRAATAHR